MRWLQKILQYRDLKAKYIKHNKLLKAAFDNGYITKIQFADLIKRNEKLKKRFKHATAVWFRGYEIYNFYFKTTTEKHSVSYNIKFEENMYIGNEAIKVQFKTEQELSPNMKKRLFKDEEALEAFLKSSEKEAENLNIIDSTLDFYLEEKMFELAYINKMQAGLNQEELNLFQKEWDDFLLETTKIGELEIIKEEE